MIKSVSERIRTSVIVRSFANRHPKAYTWINARLTAGKFIGLPFTILAIVFLLNAFLLAHVVEDVINSEMLVAVDKRVAEYYFEMRTPLISKFFFAFTQLGNRYVVLGIAIIVSVILLLRKKKVEFFGLLGTLVGSSLSMALGKHIFHVARPLSQAYYYEKNFSFPSGHATTAASFYLFLYYLWFRSSVSAFQRTGIVLMGITTALTLAFSRLYLGVHFLTDVLGGLTLGVGWLLFSISLVEWKK